MADESPVRLLAVSPACPPSSRTLRRVLAGELCAGCGLCAGISDGAISMVVNEQGFARPQQTEPVSAAIEKAICAACPGNVIAPWIAPPGHREIHPSWGPISQCLTGHATNESVRFAGSSGGLLSALAIHALESGAVTAVAHIGADTDNPLHNRIFVSRSADEVIARAGSRYAPSPALESIESLLRSTDRFLLVGKPCDISAMRQLARMDARVDERIPYMLSFFCGGMPSIHGTHAIIHALGIQVNTLQSFRYRGNGWPGTAQAVAQSGDAATMSYARSWGDFLSGRVQYRCKICPDAVGGVADIACADAWYGGESGYPLFDEQDGRSLAISRNEAGNALLAATIAAGQIACQALAVSEIDAMQPAQARRKRLVAARSLAARLLWRPQPTMRGLAILRAAAIAGPMEQLRNLSGSLLRIVRNRR